MGGLAHELEEAGVATTQISLIREHTEKIRPPRALWVPFDLGRPLGAPGEDAFQRRVLRAALELLEAPEGPVLVDFPEDAPDYRIEPAPLYCPVSFGASVGEGAGADGLLAEVRDELAGLRPWHDLALARRGRTTDLTGLGPEEAAALLGAFVRLERLESPVPGLALSAALRMAAEDLKAYYLEAVTAQPGQPTDARSLADWFWGGTAAARLLDAARRVALDCAEEDLQLLGKLLLVPRTQLHRFEAG